MKTSSDIKALFDHFGGNPDDYHEIGRESESRIARTRWSLLATLDLSQPQVPAVAPRPAPNSMNGHSEFRAERSAKTNDAAVLAARAQPRFFARLHPHAIPPVKPQKPPAPGSSSRFSVLDEETGDIDPAETGAPIIAHAEFTVASLEAPSVSFTAATVLPTPTPVLAPLPIGVPQATQVRVGVAAVEPVFPASPPASVARVTPAAAQTRAPSILSKLFAPAETPEAGVAPQSTVSLKSVFERLRHSGGAKPSVNSSNGKEKG